jgi:hypothetical protein
VFSESLTDGHVNGEGMRIFAVIFGLVILFTGMPAWKAEALISTSHYQQLQRGSTPRQCPKNYRWDAQTAKCRRLPSSN